MFILLFLAAQLFLRIAGVAKQCAPIYLNIHSRDLSAADRAAIEHACLAANNEALADPDHALFFALGDFNIIEHPARSLTRPIDIHANE
eukprot:4697807-Pyramimonas_sp.AAC.1